MPSLRDSGSLLTVPGTYVPGYHIPPLRGWGLVRGELRAFSAIQSFDGSGFDFGESRDDACDGWCGTGELPVGEWDCDRVLFTGQFSGERTLRNWTDQCDLHSKRSKRHIYAHGRAVIYLVLI